MTFVPGQKVRVVGNCHRSLLNKIVEVYKVIDNYIEVRYQKAGHWYYTYGSVSDVAPLEDLAMNLEQLKESVNLPETHQKILGDYTGAYALGVIEHPGFLLRVEDADVSRFPTKVEIDGVEVSVLVKGNFVPPSIKADAQ